MTNDVSFHMDVCVYAERTSRPPAKVQAEIDAAMTNYDDNGNGLLEFAE